MTRRDGIVNVRAHRSTTQHFTGIMMMIFSPRPNGLQLIFYLCFIEVSKICLSWVSASSSDMLIIRHGRSRVRHSSEKNHIRWGLQAFDNLTLYDYDYETNGTNGINETIFDFGMNGGNQTFLGEPFGYFSSETIFNNATSTSSINNSVESKLISTLAPSSASSRWSALTFSTPPKNQKLAKKKIMENIRKNVEEGIEYLRTHAHLTQPTAEMPSEKVLLQIQKQAEQLANTEKHRMPIAKDESSSMSALTFRETGSISSAQLPISKLFKSLPPSTLPSPSSSSGSINHARTQHNQSNQKKHKIDEQLQWKPYENDGTMSKNYVAGHGKPNHSEYEMQNDEPHNENIHQSESHPFKSNKFNKSNPRHEHEPSSPVSRSNSIATMKTIDSIVTSINAAVSKKYLDQAINNGVKGNSNGNLNAPKANLRSQSNSKMTSRSQSVNGKRIETQHHVTQPKHNSESPVSSVASLISHALDLEMTKSNDSVQSNVKSMANLNNQFESKNFLSPFDELNDEQQMNDENGDGDTNSFPFDTNYEQIIGFDGKTLNSNDIIQLPIFRLEDIDLDDFDEISRNNRLNLQKGRDVVTKFLQIVESQHLLGANCTAGTALNLGEGVVDRYAQDRFRVEAEVAVNRANMLTRFVEKLEFGFFDSNQMLVFNREFDKKFVFSWFCRALCFCCRCNQSPVIRKVRDSSATDFMVVRVSIPLQCVYFLKSRKYVCSKSR